MLREHGAYIERLTNNACAYLQFLQQEYGLLLTLHPREQNMPDTWTSFLNYNYHSCALCAAVKSAPEAWAHCVGRQDKVLQKAKAAPYIGTCYAGVTECVFPLLDVDGQARGFLCVSGYQRSAEETRARIRSVSARYNLPLAKLEQAARQLNPVLPSPERLQVLLAPLQDALAALLYFNGLHDAPPGDSPRGEALYIRMVGYVNDHYRQADFSLQAISRHFHISPAYASHLFTRFDGLPLGTYVRRLRVETAKKCLRYTDVPISEVASEVGYDDANYFSAVFHREAGCTPGQWRKRSKSNP